MKISRRIVYFFFFKKTNLTVYFMQTIETLRATKSLKTTLKVKVWALLISGQTESGGSRWCFAEGPDSRGAFTSAEQNELLHPGTFESQEHLCLARSFGCASPFREQSLQDTEFLCSGPWLLSKSWNMARGPAVAVLLQWVLFGCGRCYQNEYNLFWEGGDAFH